MYDGLGVGRVRTDFTEWEEDGEQELKAAEGHAV